MYYCCEVAVNKRGFKGRASLTDPRFQGLARSTSTVILLAIAIEPMKNTRD